MRLSGETANLEFDSGNVSFLQNTPTSVDLTTTLNLRTALGDMYNKYNKFLMVLNSFGGFAGSVVTYTGQGSPVTATVGITGDIPFLSNSLNGQISTVAYFPLRFILPNNGYTSTNSTIQNGIVFQKPANEVATVTLTPYLVRGGAIALINSANSNSLYDFNYSFTIYGLSE